MTTKTRVIEFPKDRLMGYVHLQQEDGPMEFHGRFKKDGDPFEDVHDSSWTLLGKAKATVEIPESSMVLLEVLPKQARDLSPLAALDADDLAAIWLGNTYVNDDQLKYLSHLTGLQWIDVQNNGEITDAGIAHLAQLRSLKVFVAHWTRISAISLHYLALMPELTYLDIWGCEIPVAAVNQFKHELPNCTVRTD